MPSGKPLERTSSVPSAYFKVSGGVRKIELHDIQEIKNMRTSQRAYCSNKLFQCCCCAIILSNHWCCLRKRWGCPFHIRTSKHIIDQIVSLCLDFGALRSRLLLRVHLFGPLRLFSEEFKLIPHCKLLPVFASEQVAKELAVLPVIKSRWLCGPPMQFHHKVNLLADSVPEHI